jgi:hypothetical protein
VNNFITCDVKNIFRFIEELWTIIIKRTNKTSYIIRACAALWCTGKAFQKKKNKVYEPIFLITIKPR